MRLRLPRLIAALLVVCCSLPAYATIMQKLTVSSLAQQADLVAVGRIVETKVDVSDGGVWTTVTVSPEKAVKGKVASTIRFRIPGGERVVNGRVLVTRVDGAPVVNLNQKAVFFLSATAPDRYTLTGLSQGYWRVESRNGVETATSAADHSLRFPLDRFIQRVREEGRVTKRQR